MNPPSFAKLFGAALTVVSLVFGTAPVPLVANPSGAAVQFGDITFVSQGNTLQVIQGTANGVINWNSFSINAGETTQFVQPGSTSATLNRVTGGSTSVINGNLFANGRVFLLNSNGILVGSQGVVDVGGFVASTLDIPDQEFLAGGDLNFRGSSQAAVVNLGKVSASTGDIFLVGAEVLNAGSLKAPNGTVGLAAGNDVLIAESGSERVFVRGASGGRKEDGVINQGTIDANMAELKSYGGNIYGMAVKNEGRVAATAVTREGGQVFLRAGGSSRVRSTGTIEATNGDNGGSVTVDGGQGLTEVGGSIDASGSAGQGGEVALLGDEVSVLENARVLAEGDAGGGAIRVGGGLRGQDARFVNSQVVTLGNGAVVDASARLNGNGGEVILFAEDTLRVDGNIAARAGQFGGDGGFVEVSGKRELYLSNFTQKIDVSSPNGLGGELLFDPINFTFVPGAAGAENGVNTFTDGDVNATFSGTGASVSNYFTGVTDAGEEGNITLADGVNINWTNPLGLLNFFADGAFVMQGNATIDVGGSVGISAASIDLGANTTLAGDGNLSLFAISGTEINLGDGLTGGGFDLDGNELGRLANGFNSITIGNSNGTINIGNATFYDPLTISTPNYGGKINVLGQITGMDDASITLDGGGPSGMEMTPQTTYLAGDIVTYGNAITVLDDVFLQAEVTLKTNMGMDNEAGADVMIEGAVDSFEDPMTGMAPAQNFTIDAGTGGEIKLGHTLGGVDPLGAINFKGGRFSISPYDFDGGEGEGEGGGEIGLLAVTMTPVDGIGIVSDSTVTLNFTQDLHIGSGSGIAAQGNVILNAAMEFTMDSGAVGVTSNTGDISIKTASINLNGGKIGSSGKLTIAPTTVDSFINLGVGAPDAMAMGFPTLQLTDEEIGRLEDGFSSITIGDSVSGMNTINVYGATFNDPLTLVTPGGEINIMGDLIGANEATITLDGAGPSMGLGGTSTTYLYANVVTHGNSIFVDDDVVVEGPMGAPMPVGFDTTGGGAHPTGAHVTILGTVDGSTSGTATDFFINAGTMGEIDLQDDVGLDMYSPLGVLDFDGRTMQVDMGGIFAQTGLNIDVTESFSVLNGMNVGSGGNVVINANQGGTGNKGAFHGIRVEGRVYSDNGTVALKGRSGDTSGYNGVWVRSGMGVDGYGDVLIEGSNQISSETGILVEAPVTSQTGDVEVKTNRGSIEIGNGPMASNGNVRVVGSATEGTKISLWGNYDIDSIDGGAVGTNTLDFSGLLQAIFVDLQNSSSDSTSTIGSARVKQFQNISDLVGNTGYSSVILGTDGIDQINITKISGGSVTVPVGMSSMTYDFENFFEVDALGGNDIIVINPGPTMQWAGTAIGGSGSDDFRVLSGAVANIDGDDPNGRGLGVGSTDVDTLDLSQVSTPTQVNLGSKTATGVASGFEGINSFVGGSGTGDQLIGTDNADVFEIIGMNSGRVGTVENGGGLLTINGLLFTDSGFSTLFQLPGNEEFTMAAASNGAGNGSPSGWANETLTGTNNGYVNSTTGSAGSTNGFAGTTGSSLTIGGGFGFDGIGGGGGSFVTIGGLPPNMGGANPTSYADFSGFEILDGAGGGDEFKMNGGSIGSVNGGMGTDVLSYGNQMSQVIIDLAARSANGVAMFSGLERFEGGTGTMDLLKGSSQNNTFTISSMGGGTVTDGADSFDFYGFEELSGESGENSFEVEQSGTINKVIGGSNQDSLDFGGASGPVELSFLDNSAMGSGFGVNQFEGVEEFKGSSDSDVVKATNQADEFAVTSATDATLTGDVGGSGQFVAELKDFEKLSGEKGDDVFKIMEGGSVEEIHGGGGNDTSDWSDFTTTVFADFGQPSGDWATGVGQFSSIESLIGGSDSDLILGTAGNDVFTVNALNEGTLSYQMSDGEDGSTMRQVNFTEFEALGGQAGDDRFRMLPGGSIDVVHGGENSDTLDFSAYTTPVSADFGNASATGVNEIWYLENVVGGSNTDTLSGGDLNDIFIVTANNSGFLNAGTFTSFENLFGQGGSDQFIIRNQSTLNFIDGGTGFDLLQLDDSNLTTDQSYQIGLSTITRNPTYSFAGLDSLSLLLGSGNDTVSTAGNGLFIVIDAGGGFDVLNLSPAQFLTNEPIMIGGSTIVANNFEGPFDPDNPPGTVLNQIGNNNNGGGDGDGDGSNIGNPSTLTGINSTLGNAFSSIAGQTVVIGAGGNQFELQAPVMMDGSGGIPPLIVLSELETNLQASVWAELAQAIGFSGPIMLIQNDGPLAINLTGVPPENLLAVLQENLQAAAGQELASALGLTLAIPVTNLDGGISILSIPVPADPDTIAQLAALLGEGAFSELTSALDGE